MKCWRCQGLIIHAPDEDYCINCGHRPIPIEPAPLCRGTRKGIGNCPKRPLKNSSYCAECERLEVKWRKQLVEAHNLGEVPDERLSCHQSRNGQ
jgi:hypothetical protein